MTNPKKFGFILARNFTLSPFALFIDMLRLAGDEGDNSGIDRYDWRILGQSGLPIRSSCGIDLLPTAPLARPEDYDHIVVCGGLLHRGAQINDATGDFLRAAAARKVRLTALCTGSFTLAELGLLDGYRACVNWFHFAEFRSAFPDIDATCEPLFVMDRDRGTCSGGAGAADLAAHLVRSDLGRDQARKASQILLFDGTGDKSDRQPRSTMDLQVKSPAVARAIAAMEKNLEGAVAIATVAESVGCSVRQLERLFDREVGHSPRDMYMRLRMNRARHLIEHTDMPLIAAAAEVGFVNAAHFGRVFRRVFEVTPGTMRKEAVIRRKATATAPRPRDPERPNWHGFDE